MRVLRRNLSKVGFAVLMTGPSLSAHADAPAAASHRVVTTDRAEELIARFGTLVKPGGVRSGALNRAVFDVLLALPGATQLRVYHAAYDDGRPTFVLYAADANGRPFGAYPANRVLPSDPEAPGLPGDGSGIATEQTARRHLITIADAAEIIGRFASAAAPRRVLFHSIDRSQIDALLAQPKAAGIRIYYGTRFDGGEVLVFYAIDATGHDLTDVAGLSTPG